MSSVQWRHSRWSLRARFEIKPADDMSRETIPSVNLCLRQQPRITVSHNVSFPVRNYPLEFLSLTEVCALWVFSSYFFLNFDKLKKTPPAVRVILTFIRYVLYFAFFSNNRSIYRWLVGSRFDRCLSSYRRRPSTRLWRPSSVQI